MTPSEQIDTIHIALAGINAAVEDGCQIDALERSRALFPMIVRLVQALDPSNQLA